MKTISDMKSKYLLSGLILVSMSAFLQAQTMRLVPVEAGKPTGGCPVESDKLGQTQCYMLEYTPALSGVLTSYTAGFFVSCTSLGSPIAKNRSCSMSSNPRMVNGCSSVGKVLVSCSGNTGNSVNNKIDAGVPVILHQVCFTVPFGESITIEEDPITDLTTSIDVLGGTFATEYPTFEIVTVDKIRYDDAMHAALLDFQGVPAGDHTSKLDWSTSHEVYTKTFVLERSADSETFEPIAEVKGEALNGRINSYQYFDRFALTGDNYYRLKEISNEGQVSYSPTRKVYFEPTPFEATLTPNPAKDKLYVSLKHASQPGLMVMMDISGKERLRREFDPGSTDMEVLLDKLEAGTYTVRVTSGQESHVEKVIVIK